MTLAGCAPVPGGSADGFDPDYNGVLTSLLEGDLVQFHVTMSGARSGSDVDDYAECAAAQYALIRGYGFARHVRTTMKQEGGNQTADAVYTISPSLPRGLRTIDAEVVVANCEANGIPTV
ncbi:hypothetical protein [uncultured Pseudophaeobacter sp.]|uniref:hypothetical protein n=1 Tax=uncultured Pseudophaeobacter sp. TaxID=1759421 RepID=UPI0025FD1DBC|nr:hypothetical protein [uncultured Pseudophaeobacter sp.]